MAQRRQKEHREIRRHGDWRKGITTGKLVKHTKKLSKGLKAGNNKSYTQENKIKPLKQETIQLELNSLVKTKNK